MIRCDVAVASKKVTYIKQLTAGYLMLERAGKIELHLSEKPKLKEEFHHDAVVEAIIDQRYRLIYDLTDGYNNYPSFSHIEEMLKNVDVYFKASLKEDYHQSVPPCCKLLPLAPRYRVTIRNSWADQIDYSRIFRGDRSELKALLWKTFPFFENSLRNYYAPRFTAKGVPQKETRIFFFTRLWDPDIASSYSSRNVDIDGVDVKQRIEKKREEYAAISDLRATLVKRLKEEFGDSFIGGIAPTQYAVRKYPDLIGDASISKRPNYTRNMHRADICVNTQGTHGCYNFSFGEELAAARGIVTEKPIYVTPPFLSEGVNFLTYASVEECLQKVTELYENPSALAAMMKANEDYYNAHLRPDKLVQDTLDIVLR